MKFIGFGAMDVTEPYKFIAFGDVHDPKPCKFIGFGAMDVTKPYELIGFGDTYGPKPYELTSLVTSVAPNPMN